LLLQENINIININYHYYGDSKVADQWRLVEICCFRTSVTLLVLRQPAPSLSSTTTWITLWLSLCSVKIQIWQRWDSSLCPNSALLSSVCNGFSTFHRHIFLISISLSFGSVRSECIIPDDDRINESIILFCSN